MARIEDLVRSISSMTDVELHDHIMQIRAYRRRPKSTKEIPTLLSDTLQKLLDLDPEEQRVKLKELGLPETLLEAL